jgi:hypothetical protein
LPVLFWLSCPGCPVLAVYRHRFMSYGHMKDPVVQKTTVHMYYTVCKEPRKTLRGHFNMHLCQTKYKCLRLPMLRLKYNVFDLSRLIFNKQLSNIMT